MPICFNCGKSYESDRDDGYCSDSCWEIDNCITPTITEDIEDDDAD